ncbi:ribonuclease E inhibitor RraB [Hyphobacterium marinum]|uniref:Ribonuclease E inhibitor RraB n=1 Tax=Hyphobacterium marinum TaxID=3116574 RepID=A0ABU7LY97_9PROT|nr:ribonuclease E inhibitor RraB [Hyphobacterium sp. Y6023]MEE2566532.1 ribonuclease E inhibitor RraB [Hyphobacterium sp. Y6023]
MAGSSDDLPESDRKVLEQLTSLGDTLEDPRHTLLYFYQTDGDTRTPQDAFGSLVQAIDMDNLETTIRDRDGDHPAVLIIEGTMRVDPAAVQALNDWARQWAETCGVEYDGWECAVITDTPPDLPGFDTP